MCDELKAGCEYIVEWKSRLGFRAVYRVFIHDLDERGNLHYEILENMLRPNAKLPIGLIPSCINNFTKDCPRLTYIKNEKYLKKIRLEYRMER